MSFALADQTYTTGFYSAQNRTVNFHYIVNELSIDPTGVVSSETEIGRRGVLHEYPYKDTPYFEDMGRKARVFNIEVVLQGQDHVTQTENLIDLIELPINSPADIGILSHPQRGIIEVVPVRMTIRDADEHVGVTKISLSFIEAGEFSLPASIIVSGSIINTDNIRSSLDAEVAATTGILSTTSFANDANGTAQQNYARFISRYIEDPNAEAIAHRLRTSDDDVLTTQLLLSTYVDTITDGDGGLPLTRSEALERSNFVARFINNQINNGDVTDPETIQTYRELEYGAYLAYQKTVGNAPVIFSKEYGTNLPSILISKDLKVRHEDIFTGNIFIDPMFAPPTINYFPASPPTVGTVTPSTL